ncbi:MAG TPA: CDP-alcohol phosphatidyltransferase family protein [Mariprofundaceae bacterium]|nr:CDP-alcohol phosphatidyltransferase family protein [Mariprofundaceae bacterium]
MPSKVSLRGNILSVPNALSLLRIVLTPVIAYAIIENHLGLALGMMVVAGLTDMLDGAIARYFDQRTLVGAYLDPLADKLMLISAIVALFITGKLPLFLFLAVIFRDVIIVIGAILYEVVTHKLEMQPTFTSKATTLFQILLVIVVLLGPLVSLPGWLEPAAVWLTFGLTCVSGVQYMLLWTIKAVRAVDKH